MSVELIVYNALVSSGVAAYVEDVGSPSPFRIYPEAAPQEALFPLVVYRIIAREAVKNLDGSAGLARTVVQVDCVALSVLTAAQMGDLVNASMFGNFATFSGLEQDRRNFFDNEQGVFVCSQDFAIWA